MPDSPKKLDEDYRADIEEPATVLESPDLDPEDFWEAKQKDLVTSVLDYNLNSLADLITSKAIDLSPRYQRRQRWDQSRQSKLIESFLMNVPVPPIFLNEDSYGSYSVIDGKQRLSAIHDFIRGRLKLRGLKVFHDINTLSIDSLPEGLQNALRTRANVRVVIVLRQSDPELKFEVFRRLNTGGVRLNPQEIRNSTWPGPMNDLILDLSVNATFHALLGIKNKEKSAIFKEMRDAEFVLRFFAFRNTWETFRGGMMRRLDAFMVDHQRPGDEELNEARKSFLDTLGVVRAAFGPHAFQRWSPEKGQWRKQVLASLFDAQMFASMDLRSDQVAPHRDELVAMMQRLCGDQEFRKAIDAATNTPQLFKNRIRLMREQMRAIVN